MRSRAMLCAPSQGRLTTAKQSQTERQRDTESTRRDGPGERQQSGFGALRCLCQLKPTKPQEIIIAQRAVGKSLVRGERGELSSLWLAGIGGLWVLVSLRSQGSLLLICLQSCSSQRKVSTLRQFCLENFYNCFTLIDYKPMLAVEDPAGVLCVP